MKKIVIILLSAAALFALAALTASRVTDIQKDMSAEQASAVHKRGELGFIAETGYDIGQIPPDFTLTALDGTSVSLSDYIGQPVMIDFWAAWCPFCRTEFPAMNAVYQRYSDEGFVLLAIHRTKTEGQETAKEFIEETNVSFTVPLDTTDEIYQSFSGVNAMPMSVFIDRNGIIRNKIFGPKNLELLERQIEEIL